MLITRNNFSYPNRRCNKFHPDLSVHPSEQLQMMLKKKYIFLVILLLKSIIGECQHPITKHFTLDDGLPSNHIYSVAQDIRGFIWLATNNGVSRFDGKNFRNYTSENGLPDNDIVEVQPDEYGRAWLSCANGVPCYIKGNKIFTPANDTLLRKVRTNNAYCRFARIGKKLVILYYGGDCIEIGERVRIINPTFQRTITGSDSKLASYDVSEQSLKIYLHTDDYQIADSYVTQSVPRPNLISVVQFLNDENLAVFLKDGTCLTFKIHRNKIVRNDSVLLPLIYTCLYRYDGLLWGASDGNGIIPLQEDCRREPNRPILFANKQVHRFLKDREGNYWGCSLGNGLFMIPNKNIDMYDMSDGLYQNSVLKMAICGNDLFLGYNNFNIQGIDGHHIINYLEKHASSIISPIRGLAVNKNYIVAGSNEGFTAIDRKKNSVNTVKIGSLKSVHLIGDDTLLIGTHSACFVAQLPSRFIDTIRCNKAMVVYRNRNKDILIGSVNELLRCRKNKDNRWVIDTPTKILGPDNKLSISRILELNNKLIIGTERQGLIALTGDDYEYIKLGENLKYINCKSLIEDRIGNVWASSFQGIHKITFHDNIHQYSVVNYHKKNGLPFQDINDLQIIDDTVYAACSNGIIRFPISERIDTHIQKPLVYITDIHANDSNYISEYNQSNYHLPAHTKSVSFSFSGIEYKSLGNIEFRYRLRGLNDSWQSTKGNNVKYESLSSGVYTFEVWAVNEKGIRSARSGTVTITIAPNWWEKKIFIILFLLFSISIILIIARYVLSKKHKKQLKEASLKRLVAEIELKAIKAQINPHFIFNTLNSIQYLIGNDQKEAAELYLSKLGSLLRSTLNFSSNSEIFVADEIKYLENYLQLEKLRFDENFSYTLQNNLPRNVAEHIKIPPMVLQPHIENALKHSFQGFRKMQKRIIIQFDYVPPHLICVVQDNGIGRKASLEKRKTAQTSYVSKGVELSQAKLEMYEKLTGKNVRTEITDLYEQDKPSGTKVTITINVDNE